METRRASSASPAISVIMAVADCEKFIFAAVESVLAQSRGDFEFLIADDGSTDRTGDELSAIKDSRIKVERISENIGLTRALNRLLLHARGEYIARMDADDICHPERFKSQTAFLDAHPDHGVVGSWATVIDENGGRMETPWRPCDHRKIMSYILHDNPFVHSSLMFRKSTLESVGGYDERWKYAQDYDLLLRLSRVTKLANLGEPMHQWRTTRQSITTGRRSEQLAARDEIRRSFFSACADQEGISLETALANFINYPDDMLLENEWRNISDRMKKKAWGQAKVFGAYITNIASNPAAVARFAIRGLRRS